MQILSILEEIGDTTSRKQKLELLQKHKDNKLLKSVLFVALNPEKNYKIDKIPKYFNKSISVNLETAIELLEPIETEQLIGTSAECYLSDILSDLNEHDAEIIKRIVNKDLMCGLNINDINKIWR